MDNVISFLPEQMPLRPVLPTVHGNVDYQQFRSQLERIDALLSSTGLEEEILETALERWKVQNSEPAPSPKAQLHYQKHSRQALRCNIARILVGESFRDFSAHLADSSLLQWFCQLGQMDRIQVPSKSTLQRYDQWFPEEEVRQLNTRLLGQAAQEANPFELQETIDLEGVILDTTCVKANIHFPVDWLLLRDASRSLLTTISTIRKHGLKHRMPDPQELLREMNKQAVEMSQCRRHADSKRKRKAIVRKMKRLVDQIAGHARRYKEQLEARWQETDWSRAQAEQVLGRLQSILDQLPAARKQAHERIIGERKVANKDKILSLYEPDVHVLIRGKASAEVEFGNGLLIAENPQGLLLHWELFEEQPPADSQLVIPTIQEIETLYGVKMQVVGADRGFESAKNVQHLEDKEIYNGLCARNPKELSRRMNEEEEYEATQRRRAQTEGRIGIFKNQFLGRPMRAKGFGNRNLAVTWAALTHNLWVLARLPIQEKSEEEPQAQAA